MADFDFEEVWSSESIRSRAAEKLSTFSLFFWFFMFFVFAFVVKNIVC